MHQLLRQIIDRATPPSDRLLASIRIELLSEIKTLDTVEYLIVQQLMAVFYAVAALQKRIAGWTSLMRCSFSYGPEQVTVCGVASRLSENFGEQA